MVDETTIFQKGLIMKKQRFICKNCGCRFEKEVFEEGEAEEKRVPTGPVRCPQCKSTNVKEI